MTGSTPGFEPLEQIPDSGLVAVGIPSPPITACIEKGRDGRIERGCPPGCFEVKRVEDEQGLAISVVGAIMVSRLAIESHKGRYHTLKQNDGGLDRVRARERDIKVH